MQVMEWITLMLNVACLFGSMFGAYKSLTNYRRCKQLTNYANLNTALSEIKNIYKCLKELLRFSNDNLIEKGANVQRQISDCATRIRDSLIIIRDNIPLDLSNSVDQILGSQINGTNADNYIDTLISGAELDISDKEYENLKRAIHDVQKCIRQKMESIQNSEKNI